MADHLDSSDNGPRNAANESKESKLAQVPCKFYRAGACSAGQSCPFSHTATDREGPKETCQWFIKGNCKFGHKCALAHLLPGQPIAMDRKNKKAAQLASQLYGYGGQNQGGGGAFDNIKEKKRRPPNGRYNRPNKGQGNLIATPPIAESQTSPSTPTKTPQPQQEQPPSPLALIQQSQEVLTSPLPTTTQPASGMDHRPPTTKRFSSGRNSSLGYGPIGNPPKPAGELGNKNAVYDDSDDFEEFLPSCLNDLLTPEERQQRAFRSGGQRLGLVGEPIGIGGSIGGGGIGGTGGVGSFGAGHRYSRSVPAARLLEATGMWRDIEHLNDFLPVASLSYRSTGLASDGAGFSPSGTGFQLATSNASGAFLHHNPHGKQAERTSCLGGQRLGLVSISDLASESTNYTGLQPTLDPTRKIAQVVATNGAAGSSKPLESSITVQESVIHAECAVCRDESDRIPSNPPTKWCSHSAEVCMPCLQESIRVAVYGGIMLSSVDEGIPCPSDGCDQKMKYADIKVWATKTVFDEYDKALLRHQMVNDDQYVRCLNIKCNSGQLHDGSDDNPIVTCYSCGSKQCFQHQSIWHEGFTCTQWDEHQKVLKEDEALSNDTISKTTLPCPGCGKRIEKRSGCDVMTCRCGHQFCWLCSAPWKPIVANDNSYHRSDCKHYRPGAGPSYTYTLPYLGPAPRLAYPNSATPAPLQQWGLDDDFEEFLPSSLNDLLTPEERQRRASRSGGQRLGLFGEPIGIGGSIGGGGFGVTRGVGSFGAGHRYSRSIPAAPLFGTTGASGTFLNHNPHGRQAGAGVDHFTRGNVTVNTSHLTSHLTRETLSQSYEESDVINTIPKPTAPTSRRGFGYGFNTPARRDSYSMQGTSRAGGLGSIDVDMMNPRSKTLQSPASGQSSPRLSRLHIVPGTGGTTSDINGGLPNGTNSELANEGGKTVVGRGIRNPLRSQFGMGTPEESKFGLAALSNSSDMRTSWGQQPSLSGLSQHASQQQQVAGSAPSVSSADVVAGSFSPTDNLSSGLRPPGEGSTSTRGSVLRTTTTIHSEPPEKRKSIVSTKGKRKWYQFWRSKTLE